MKYQRLAAAFALSLVTATAAAGPIEDSFRDFIDRLKRAGQSIAAQVPGFLGTRVTQPFVMNRVDTLPLAQLSVVVFVSPNCADCAAAVADARGVAATQVEVMDITSSATAREAFALTRATGLPATMAGTQILVGRQPTMLQSMVGAAGMGQTPVAN